MIHFITKTSDRLIGMINLHFSNGFYTVLPIINSTN